MNSSDISQWARQREFLTEVYYHLKRTLSKEQIEELKMSSFTPYVDIENNQLSYHDEPSKNQGFMYLKRPNGESIVLEYRDEQVNTISFQRVHDVYHLIQDYITKNNLNDNPFSMSKEEQDKYQNISSCNFSLSLFLENDPNYMAQKKAKEIEQAQLAREFSAWCDSAHEIKHFELVHRDYSSTNYTFLTLLEKDGVYKILQSDSGCFSSSSEEFDIAKLDTLLKQNYNQATLENLQMIHTLIHEKPMLESKIKAFRKPETDDSNTQKNKI